MAENREWRFWTLGIEDDDQPPELLPGQIQAGFQPPELPPGQSQAGSQPPFTPQQSLPPGFKLLNEAKKTLFESKTIQGVPVPDVYAEMAPNSNLTTRGKRAQKESQADRNVVNEVETDARKFVVELTSKIEERSFSKKDMEIVEATRKVLDVGRLIVKMRKLEVSPAIFAAQNFNDFKNIIQER